MIERWVDTAYANYMVSDHGNVRGRRGICKQRVCKGSLTVGIGHVFTTKSVNRLVAIAFIPNPEGLPYVRHRDGNKLNNHWTNLYWDDKKNHDGICKICQEKKDLNHFEVKKHNKTLSDGTVKKYSRRLHICHKCDYQRQKLASFKRIHNEIFNKLKNDAGVHPNGNTVQSIPDTRARKLGNIRSPA